MWYNYNKQILRMSLSMFVCSCRPCSLRVLLQKTVDDELHVAHSKIYILHACIAIFIGTPCEGLLKYIITLW